MSPDTCINFVIGEHYSFMNHIYLIYLYILSELHTCKAQMTYIYLYFSVDINPVLSHITSRVCCWPIYFIKELMRLIRRLLRKYLCKISMRLFSVMGSDMIRKFGFWQTDITADVITLFKVKNVTDQVQVLFPNYSFQNGVFNASYSQILCTILCVCVCVCVCWISFFLFWYYLQFVNTLDSFFYNIYQPLGQDMTLGQFLSGV